MKSAASLAYVLQHRRVDYNSANENQQQIYHVLDSEGLMEIDGARRVVKKHDVIYIPPGAEHALYNTGFTELTFIVVTSPPEDQ